MIIWRGVVSVKRVSFRPIELRDVDTVYRFRLDEEVMFWAAGGYGGAMQSLAELEANVKNQKASDSSRMFVIEAETAEGPLVIGTISFRDFDRINHRVTVGMFI